MSVKPDDNERLAHIIDAIDRIERFTKGMDYGTFAEDEVLQFAVIKNFEIIGEAAYYLTDELKEAHPQVEWKKIIVFRHILVHDYYKINLELVWRAKENKLEGLKNQVSRVMEEK